MISVGDTVQFKDRWSNFAKGQKVVLRARVKFLSDKGSDIASGCIVETSKGVDFIHCKLDRIKIVELDRELNLDDKITFIPEHFLEPWDHSDNIILRGLSIIWSSVRTDYHNKWRKEYELKHGYDPHKYLYK
jgi:hypothetical protein